MDQESAELSRFQASLRCDVLTADGVRASHVQHAVEDGRADGRFGLLDGEGAGSQARTDDGLLSSHSGFNESALAVVSFLLPAQPSFCGS
jgi:hypothetical protein